MISDNPYEEIIPFAFESINNRISVVGELSTLMDNFLSCFMEIISRINETTEKTSNDINSQKSSHLSLNTNAWLSEYVATPSGLYKFIAKIKSNVVNPLHAFKSNLENQKEYYTQKVGRYNKELETAENEYNQIYTNYLNFCEQLEKEKDLSKIGEMKKRCSEMEQMCLSGCKTLSTKRRTYCLNIERFFVDSLQNEDSYYQLIDKVGQELTKTINELSTFYGSLSEEGFNVLEQLKNIRDERTVFASTQRDPHPVNLASNSIDLQFNIFDYIDYKYIFKNDLSAKTYICKEAFNDDISFGFKLKENEVIEVIEHFQTISTVESSETGIRGDVPNDLISELPFQRYICQLTKDYEIQNRKFCEGYYFCVINEKNDTVLCKTASKSLVVLPKSAIKGID